MIWQALIGVLLSAVIVVGYAVIPPSADFQRMFPATGGGDLARILFFHVPMALISYICFVIATVQSVKYLRTRDHLADRKAARAVEQGLLYCVLATVTGSIFAKSTWGAYWNWDPRQTSIVLLLLIYAAYTALRSAVEDPERRASLSAVYALLSIVVATFLMFVVPRIPALESLHPNNTLTSRQGMDAAYRLVFFGSMIAFTGLFVWIYRLSLAIDALHDRLEEMQP